MGFMLFVYGSSDTFWKSIPVLLTISICDGLLFALFTKNLPRRFSSVSVRILVFAGFCASYFWLFCQYYEVLRHSLILYAILSGYLLISTKLVLTNALFLSSAFVLIIELARGIVKDGLFPNFLLALLPNAPSVWINSILLAGCILILTGLILLLQPIYCKYETIPLTVSRLLILLIPFFLYLFVKYTKFYIMTSETYDDTLLLRMWFTEIALCICAIAETAILANMVYAQQTVNQHLKMEMLLRSQQEQYRIKSESIAAINRKYHDLKHMLSGMRAMTQIEASQFAEAMEKEIQPFECIQETGNQMLNILLSEKIRECQEKNIRIIPYIDAAGLGFVNDMDLCLLFGNAIDNAIEATSKIPEDHREIYIKIRRTGDMMLLCFQNSFDGPVSVRDGRLLTSKENASEHGFGTQNIRLIVEKYNGTSAFETEEHIFTLNILIPIPVQT